MTDNFQKALQRRREHSDDMRTRELYADPVPKARRPSFAPGKEPPLVHERAKCANCADTLRPQIHGGYEGTPLKFWTGGYHSYGDGHFCSLRCCEAFAAAAYRDGKRLWI